MMDIKELQQILDSQSAAPVELWNPEHCGSMDLVIKKDGSWWHQGSAIKRQSLVKLFSTILKRENDDYYLVTPVEKISIKVEDAPFVAVDFDAIIDDNYPHPWLVFETNVGDKIKLDKQHPLLMFDANSEHHHHFPYLLVRSNLYAKLTRSNYYHLVDLAEQYLDNNIKKLRVWSGPSWFELGSIE